MLVSTNLTSTECPSCGVMFAVPQLMFDQKVEKGGYFHCPNGHSIGWGEGKTEKALRIADKDLEKQRKMIYDFSAEVTRLERSNQALKAANTRLKKKKKGK